MKAILLSALLGMPAFVRSMDNLSSSLASQKSTNEGSLVTLLLPEIRHIITALWLETLLSTEYRPDKIINITIKNVLLAISRNGKTALILNSPNRFILWDTKTEKPLKKLKLKRAKEEKSLPIRLSNFYSAVLSADGTIALISFWFGEALLWNTSTGELRKISEGCKNTIKLVALSANGNYALTGFGDETTLFWNTSTGELIRTFKHPYSIDSVALNAHGNVALMGCKNGIVLIVNTITGEQTIISTECIGPVIHVTLSDDGKTAVIGSRDKIAHVWDTSKGQHLVALKGHTNSITSIALSPEGRTAVTGSSDHTALVWDTITGEPVTTLGKALGEITHVALNVDEVLTFNYNQFTIWKKNSDGGKWKQKRKEYAFELYRELREFYKEPLFLQQPEIPSLSLRFISPCLTPSLLLELGTYIIKEKEKLLKSSLFFGN